MSTQVVPIAGQTQPERRRFRISGVLAAGLFQFASSWANADGTCPYDQGQTVTLKGSVWTDPLKRDDGYVVFAVKTVECPDDLFNLFVNPQAIQVDSCAKGSKVSGAGQINSIASISPGRIFNISASSSTCIASQQDARDNCLTGTSLHADNDCIEAARLHPDDADVQFNLGKFYHNQKNYSAAMTAYKQAIAINPNKQLYYSLRCGSAVQIKDWPTVEADCSKALSMVRKDEPGSNISQIVDLENRASAYLALDMYDKAIADYTVAVNIDDAQTIHIVPGLYHVKRGIAYRAKGDFASAIVDFRVAGNLAPKDPSVAHWEGWSLYDSSDGPGAIAAFARELKLSKAADPYTIIMLYFARLRLGDASAAQKLSKGSARVVDKAAWPWAVIDVLGGKQAATDALAAARAAGSGQECEANFYLGEWYAILKDKGHAEPLLRKVLADCPHDFVEYQSANFALPRLLGGTY